jgi:phosphate acetyltransferase
MPRAGLLFRAVKVVRDRMNDFLRGMIERASEDPKRIVFPESACVDILRTAAEVVRYGMGTPVLVGSQGAVEALCKENGIVADGFEYFDNGDASRREELAQRYVELGFTEYSHKAVARKCKNEVNCGMFLVKCGLADCCAAGKEYSTGDVVFSAMSFLGLADGVGSPSSLGIADIPGFEGPQGSMLALADCAITAQPNANELAGIAISSADTVHSLLGWEPRVAMLAFSTKGSADHPTVDVVREAVQRVHELRPDIKCDGELQLDAAIIPAVAAHKVGGDSEVAGKANVLIFPNLHAGNIGVKLVQIFGHANAYGPVLQGFAKPVCDFSRSAPVEEMLGNVAMLAIRAR